MASNTDNNNSAAAAVPAAIPPSPPQQQQQQQQNFGAVPAGAMNPFVHASDMQLDETMARVLAAKSERENTARQAAISAGQTFSQAPPRNGVSPYQITGVHGVPIDQSRTAAAAWSQAARAAPMREDAQQQQQQQQQQQLHDPRIDQLLQLFAAEKRNAESAGITPPKNQTSSSADVDPATAQLKKENEE